MNQNTKRRWLAALLGAAAGMVVFFLLYGTSTLHPTYDAWILNGYDEWDIQQHYAGWVLFRNSHWAFPLGLADTIAAPDGTVISFTDSIPWVSIFFKALRGVLPSTFQWFGWYTLFCFAMQGAAGALLCARGQAKTGAGALVFSTLGGLLFVMLPTLWERAFRHTALASQWLFLLALYAFLEYRQNLHSDTAKFPWAMPVLAFLAVGIHPYFLPLVMICALLAAVEEGRADLGLSVRPAPQQRLRYQHLLDDPMVLLCRADDPLAARPSVPWSVFAQGPFISSAPASSIRQITDAVFVQKRLTLRPTLEYPRVTACGALVAAGLGIAALPRLALVLANLQGLAAAPLVRPQASRAIGIVTRIGRTLPPVARAFMATLLELYGPTQPRDRGQAGCGTGIGSGTSAGIGQA